MEKDQSGKPYGAWWVALMDNSGKKKYFTLENLAAAVFGADWKEMKTAIAKEKLKSTLGDMI